MPLPPFRKKINNKRAVENLLFFLFRLTTHADGRTDTQSRNSAIVYVTVVSLSAAAVLCLCLFLRVRLPSFLFFLCIFVRQLKPVLTGSSREEDGAALFFFFLFSHLKTLGRFLTTRHKLLTHVHARTFARFPSGLELRT